MTRIVQEKFQVRPPQNHNDEEPGWTNDKSARAKKNTPGREGAAGGDAESRFVDNAVFYNGLPPGMDVEDQELTDQRRLDIVMGGATDISKDYNPGAVEKGFTRKKMLGTDDEYSNEHTDIFYGEAKVGDDIGFVERGNLLDRM